MEFNSSWTAFAGVVTSLDQRMQHLNPAEGGLDVVQEASNFSFMCCSLQRAYGSAQPPADRWAHPYCQLPFAACWLWVLRGSRGCMGTPGASSTQPPTHAALCTAGTTSAPQGAAGSGPATRQLCSQLHAAPASPGRPFRHNLHWVRRIRRPAAPAVDQEDDAGGGGLGATHDGHRWARCSSREARWPPGCSATGLSGRPFSSCPCSAMVRPHTHPFPSPPVPAAGLVLQQAPPLLVQLKQNMEHTAPGSGEHISSRGGAVVLTLLTSETLDLLLMLLDWGSDTGQPCPLPSGAARVLRSAHLRPQQLLTWTGPAAQAMLAAMQAPGAGWLPHVDARCAPAHHAAPCAARLRLHARCALTSATRGPPQAPHLATAGTNIHAPSPYLAASLRGLFAADIVPGLADALEGQPEAQEPLVALAAHALVLPEAEQAALAEDPQACGALRDLAQMLAADCVGTGRRRRQQAHGAEAAGGPGLLEAVASLAAQPQLWERRGQTEQAELLMACLELLFTLVKDPLLVAREAGQRPHVSARQLQVLGSPGGLPLLCRLAAEVAAAAPAAGSGRGGAGAAAGRAGSLPGGTCFGLCWSQGTQVPSEWATTLQRLVSLVGEVGWAGCGGRGGGQGWGAGRTQCFSSWGEGGRRAYAGAGGPSQPAGLPHAAWCPPLARSAALLLLCSQSPAGARSPPPAVWRSGFADQPPTRCCS